MRLALYDGMKKKTTSPKPEFERIETESRLVGHNWGKGKHFTTDFKTVYFYRCICGHVGESFKEYGAKYANCRVCKSNEQK